MVALSWLNLHRGSEMVPIQRLICWGGPGQQNLLRSPARAAQRPQDVDRHAQGCVEDLRPAPALRLVGRKREQGRAVAARQRRDHHPVLRAQVRHERAHGLADSVRVLHQAPDQAERQDARPPADQQSEMRAARAGHAQGVQPAQGGERDHAHRIVEQARIQSGLPDHRIGIDAEFAQGRGDFLGDAEVNGAGRQRSPDGCRDSLGHLAWWPAVACRQTFGAINLLHENLIQVDRIPLRNQPDDVPTSSVTPSCLGRSRLHQQPNPGLQRCRLEAGSCP